jgi:hypothetical protein
MYADPSTVASGDTAKDVQAIAFNPKTNTITIAKTLTRHFFT